MRLRKRAWAGGVIVLMLGVTALACRSGLYRSWRWRLSAEGRATYAFDAADKAESDGDYDRARRLLDKSLRLVPESPEVAYRSAVIEVKAGRPEAFWPAMTRAVELGYALSWEVEDEPVLRAVRKDSRYAALRDRIVRNEEDERSKWTAARRLPDADAVPGFSSLAAIQAAYQERTATLSKESSHATDRDNAVAERKLEYWRVVALRRYLDEHPDAEDHKETALALVRTWASTVIYSNVWPRETGAGIAGAAVDALNEDLAPEEVSEMRFIRAVAVLRGVLDDAHVALVTPPLEAPGAQALFDELAESGGTGPWASRAAAYSAFCALTTRPDRAREAYARYRSRPPLPDKPWVAWDAKVRDVVRETRLRLDGPGDFTAKTLEGRTVTLSAMKGQVVLVDFWSPG